MVIFGGLEVVAAGYLIHKHNKNKQERERLREAEELIEEEEDAIRRHKQKLYNERHPRPPRDDHRRRRSDSRDRKHTHHRRRQDEDEPSHDRRRREHSEPPRPKPIIQTQAQVAPGVVAGWPAHWEQAQTPQLMAAPPSYSNLHPNYQYPHDKTGSRRDDRRGRSSEDLNADRHTPSRTPSPRVRFDDGTVPGQDRRSPPPRYS